MVTVSTYSCFLLQMTTQPETLFRLCSKMIIDKTPELRKLPKTIIQQVNYEMTIDGSFSPESFWDRHVIEHLGLSIYDLPLEKISVNPKLKGIFLLFQFGSVNETTFVTHSRAPMDDSLKHRLLDLPEDSIAHSHVLVTSEYTRIFFSGIHKAITSPHRDVRSSFEIKLSSRAGKRRLNIVVKRFETILIPYKMTPYKLETILKEINETGFFVKKWNQYYVRILNRTRRSLRFLESTNEH